MKVLKSKKGFTMLELLMVVIVIGILASLAIPQYQSFMEKARTAEARNTIGAIKSAQELYRLENGSYGNDTQLESYISYPTTVSENGYLWYYDISDENDTSYKITATRTDKEGGNTSVTGSFVWNRSNSTSTWDGVLG